MDARLLYPEHPIPRTVTLEQCIACSDTIPFGGLHVGVEIYQTMDRVGLGETVRDRLIGGTAERFVRTFWPDFDSRDAKKR